MTPLGPAEGRGPERHHAHVSDALAPIGPPVSDKMGQFDWFSKIGATPQAVAVLNDQPILFTILLVVLVAMILQGVLIWYIHFATLKPEQKTKKEKKPSAKKNEKPAKPPAMR